MNRREFLGASSLLALGAAMPATVYAQAEKWPTREITMINGFPPGAATDLTARAIAQALEKRLGATIVVKNVVGGAGTLGPTQLSQSKPDGYTMGLVGITSIVTAPQMMDLPYKPWESFELIAGAADLRYGIGVASASPIKTVADLVALSKTRMVTYASNAPNNVIAMFQLAKLSGGRFRWVRFGGGAEAVTQAVGGHVDCCIQTVTEMKGQIESGAMRLLASAAVDRWPEQPDVATLREQGFDAVSPGPFGYAFPAGVDPAIRARMEKAFLDSLNDPELQATIRGLGVVPKAIPGKEFVAYLRQVEKDVLPILEETGMTKKK